MQLLCSDSCITLRLENLAVLEIATGSLLLEVART
jgi:hypothetical protein